MNIKKLKPTLFSVFSIIGIVLGIPFGLYCTTLEGGASLGAVLVFVAVIGFAILLAIDRVLSSYYDPVKLSVVEFIIGSILLIIYYYS